MKLKPSALPLIYFCTGARNQKLLETFASELSFETDERIASFKALGSSKIKEAPVGICTTSGTALAECLPALLEARYSEVPLVIITGDRPKKQHGTGAPQTIEHEVLTQGICGSFIEVTFEDFKDLEIEDPIYPLHINVLIDDTICHDLSIQRTKDLGEFEEFLKIHKRPLFLFSHEEKSLRPMVAKFAECGLPFYAEVMSSAHDLSPIQNDYELIQLFQNGSFDSIVRVGHTPLSKIWRLLETSTLPVMSFDSRGLSALSYGTLFPFGSDILLKNERWWKALENVSFSLRPSPENIPLDTLLEKFPLAEISLFQKIQMELPENSIVYLGNSLVIRNFEMIQKKPFRIYGNRGVNGIDGQLSTAIGMAKLSSEKVYCILGDLTARYDLSAMRDIANNLHLIILNNQGGRIFESLGLDERIILAHDENFQEIAKAFKLTYSSKVEDIQSAQVTEIFADLSQGRALMAELKS